MNIKTEKCVAEMVKWANEGNEILPAFFTPFHGRATVSAAVRVALAAGSIRQEGVDGCGNAKYVKRTVNTSSPWYQGRAA